ncbi:MAG: DUF1538 family protein [Alphaproteobacteria bacterium]|nr:DUF1538 family protein [Alphaproteobacteria bacterium]
MSAEIKIRYGDFRRETSVRKVAISYSKLTRLKAKGGGGPPRVRLGPRDLWRILAPYVGARFKDQLLAVTPLAVYLVLFQILILRQGVEDAWMVAGGLVATIVGLMLFIEGLRVGLMPFGERIGHALPQRSPLSVVLMVAFALGVGVTYAEPAIGALKTAGTIVEFHRAPLLHALLDRWANALVLVVGLGVGLAAVVGMLMFVRGWPIKPIIFAATVPVLALTAWMSGVPQLADVVPLAWDCGGVTTGPVTVPLVLALGIGVASAAGRGESSTAGFGIVTLASLFPVLGVLLLGLAVWLGAPPIAPAEVAHGAPSWWEVSPWAEVVGGLRAVVPLVAFLILVARQVAKVEIEERVVVAYGILLAVVGMVIFNLGLTYGLTLLGGQSGAAVPGAFAVSPAIHGSPLYPGSLGIAVALAFALMLGFGATLAEPALDALGRTVETLTNGAFRKSGLIYAVAAGVGAGLGLGVVKMVFGVPLAWMLVPGYALALVLTALSSREVASIAWDSAGVTTGPVTVPLVLAMGLGFGHTVGAVEGFGMLAMASVCPILSVLVLGLWVRLRTTRLRPASAGAMA